MCPECKLKLWDRASYFMVAPSLRQYGEEHGPLLVAEVTPQKGAFPRLRIRVNRLGFKLWKMVSYVTCSEALGD